MIGFPENLAIYFLKQWQNLSWQPIVRERSNNKSMSFSTDKKQILDVPDMSDFVMWPVSGLEIAFWLTSQIVVICARSNKYIDVFFDRKKLIILVFRY